MMNSTRSFTFAEGNRNIKIREVLMAEKMDLPLERRNHSELVHRYEFFADQYRHV